MSASYAFVPRHCLTETAVHVHMVKEGNVVRLAWHGKQNATNKAYGLTLPHQYMQRLWEVYIPEQSPTFKDATALMDKQGRISIAGFMFAAKARAEIEKLGWTAEVVQSVDQLSEWMTQRLDLLSSYDKWGPAAQILLVYHLGAIGRSQSDYLLMIQKRDFPDEGSLTQVVAQVVDGIRQTSGFSFLSGWFSSSSDTPPTTVEASHIAVNNKDKAD